MKNKIRILKVLAFILSFLIILIETLVIFYLLKYLIKNGHLIRAIFLMIITVVILGIIHSCDKTDDYEKFEKNEVEKWDEITFKRAICFIFKYHIHFLINLFS